MRDFAGKTAVITGAASGIGLAIAGECVRRGMNVCAVDFDADLLRDAQVKLSSAIATEVEVITEVVDVTNIDALEALHDRVLIKFGAVHLLFNNAGAMGPSSMFAPRKQLDWILDLNLKSVMHGVRIFVPKMIEHGEPAYVVNTASIYGLAKGQGPYGVTKQAVVAISEAVQRELTNEGHTNVTVAALCPSFINTKIAANKFRGGQPLDAPKTDDEAIRNVAFDAFFKTNAAPVSVVVDTFFAGIEAGKHYIHTHPEVSEILLESRVKGILKTGMIQADDREAKFREDLEQEVAMAATEMVGVGVKARL
jgi:NAD(P)-dependent dehydrogenase (short-subunit alcohol dehydrogenase family)